MRGDLPQLSGTRPIAAQRIYLDHAASTPILPAGARGDAGRNGALGQSLVAAPGRPRRPRRDRGCRARASRRRSAGRANSSSRAARPKAAALAFAPGRRKGHKPLVCHRRTRRRSAAGGGGGPAQPFRRRAWAASIPEALARHPDSAPGGLVAVQHVNSETGVIQPLAEISEAVRDTGGLLFADCAQSAGKLPLPPADLLAVSAHKLGGPPGIGALLVRDLRMLDATGGQEAGYRAGTENLPAILGFAAALDSLRDADGTPCWLDEQGANRTFLETAIEAAGGVPSAPSRRAVPWSPPTTCPI
jgi:cysteine desulfurase